MENYMAQFEDEQIITRCGSPKSKIIATEHAQRAKKDPFCSFSSNCPFLPIKLFSFFSNLNTNTNHNTNEFVRMTMLYWEKKTV